MVSGLEATLWVVGNTEIFVFLFVFLFIYLFLSLQ